MNYSDDLISATSSTFDIPREILETASNNYDGTMKLANQLSAYLMKGILPTNKVLYYTLTNDLLNTTIHIYLEGKELVNIGPTIRLLHHYVPPLYWGSHERINALIHDRGYIGRTSNATN